MARKRQFVSSGKKIDLNGKTIISERGITSSWRDSPNVALGISFPKIKANNVTITVVYTGDSTGSRNANWTYLRDGVGFAADSITLTYGNPPRQRSVTKTITDGRIMDQVQISGNTVTFHNIQVRFDDVEIIK